MILKEFFGLINLSRTLTFYIYKTIKDIMIYKDKYFIFTIF